MGKQTSVESDAIDGTPQTLPTSRDPLANQPTQPTMLAPEVIRHRLMAADLAALAVGVCVAFAAQALLAPVDRSMVQSEVILAIASLPLWFIGFHVAKLYLARANLRSSDEIRNILTGALFGICALVVLAYIGRLDGLPRVWVLALSISVTVATIVERRIARRIFRRLRRTRRLVRRVIVVGADAHAIDIADRLSTDPRLGYQPAGVFELSPSTSAGGPVTTPIDHLGEILKLAQRSESNGVILSPQSIDGETINYLIRRLTEAGLHVTVSTGLFDIDLRRLRALDLDGHAMLYVEPTIRTGWRQSAKWTFDRLIALTGLLLSLPVLAIAAAAIKLNSPGPVLFRQRRVGRNGDHFEMLKLRTMVVDAEALRHDLQEQNEADGPLFKMGKDPRITRVGAVLRRLSIDELPQFWNVIRGDMSICGPRPALPDEVAQWSGDVFERLRVLPGITGLWQVSGRADTTFEQYKRLDLYYVDNWSPVHDLHIVLRTIGAVVRSDGAR